MSDPSMMARLTAALGDRYRIDREAGAGGMATVYLAHDLKHDRDVAIKVLHPDLGAALGGERFLSEIKTTAKLQHPHILPLLDSGDAGGLLYYVMPYVTGETLRARLERERQLPVQDALLFAREIADALGAAHALGIIHRDIKPENVLLQGGHALVADFGIALAVQQAGGARMTQTGLSLGTPQYMSPEQAMGERSIDARTDLYALGAVTYEMLVGEPPFTGPSVQAIVARVMSEEPRGLVSQRKAIPEYVEDAVLRALEKLPADRFASAAEFVGALGGGATTATGTSARRAKTAPKRSNFALLGASLVAVLATVAALWGWSRPSTNAPVSRYLLTVDSVAVQHSWMGETAISPDGATILYADGLDGFLHTRHRSAIAFGTIPGTKGAVAPCFSSDGTKIAFWRNHLVIVLTLASGAQTIVSDSELLPSPCSWSDDGYLYYGRKEKELDAIVRVRPVEGAKPEIIARTNPDADEMQMILPDALPGGRGVLMQIGYRNAKTAIAVSGKTPMEHKIVVPNGVRARYAANGQLLYTTADGKLWSVAFDLGSLSVRGEPRAVAEAIPATMLGPLDFAISASGTLVYGTDLSSALSELVLVSRNGREERVDTTWHGTFTGASVSTDGTRAAVTVAEADGTADVYVKPLSSGAARKVTAGGAVVQGARFTPDGRAISFVGGGGSLGAPKGKWEVFVQPLDGSSPAAPLAKLDRSISEHAWSPSGRDLLLRTTSSEKGAGDILAGPATGPDDRFKPIRSSPSSEYSPSISPDGRYLAYSSGESGRFEIYVVPYPDPGNSKWQVTTTGGRSPRWSHKSGELFYIDPSNNFKTAKVVTSPTFAVQGTNVLFNAAAYSILAISRPSFDIMPDDQRFLMIRRRGGSTWAQLTVVENWFSEATAPAKAAEKP